MQIIPIETSKLKLHNTFKTPGKMCLCVCVYVCYSVHIAA
jgi:hypothetical protein